MICDHVVSCRNKKGCEHADPHEPLHYYDEEDMPFSCSTPHCCEGLDEEGDIIEIVVSCVSFH